jgi:hypothetical protein
MLLYNVIDLVRFLKCNSGLINNPPANVGWNKRLFASVEYHHFQVFFQLLNLHTQGRLRNETIFRSLPKMPECINGDDVLKLCQRNHKFGFLVT